jgi:hypothetical protein
VTLSLTYDMLYSSKVRLSIYAAVIINKLIGSFWQKKLDFESRRVLFWGYEPISCNCRFMQVPAHWLSFSFMNLLSIYGNLPHVNDTIQILRRHTARIVLQLHVRDRLTKMNITTWTLWALDYLPAFITKIENLYKASRKATMEWWTMYSCWGTWFELCKKRDFQP